MNQSRPAGHEWIAASEARAAEIYFLRLAEDGSVTYVSEPGSFEPPGEWLDYASALLHTDQTRLNFVATDHSEGWLAVSLQLEPDSEGDPVVRIEYKRIDPPFGTSVRELEVMTLIAAGLSNEAIAANLEISRRTVEKHTERIFGKTGIYSRNGIAGFVVDRGLLKLPTPGLSVSVPLTIGAVATMATTPQFNRPGRRPVVRASISIGMPLALESRGQDDALEMLQGARLAVDEINGRGGLLGRNIELVPVACEITDPASVREAVESLAGRDVAAITAGYFAADQTILELASDYGAPFLHAATLDCMVSWVREDPLRFSNVFQTCASDVTYGRGLARFLSALIDRNPQLLPNRRIAVIQPPWPGLDIGLRALDREIRGEGWEICIVPSPPNGSDWIGTIAALKSADPSVIYFASYLSEDSIAFQRAFRQDPLKAIVYKLYSPSVPAYLDLLGTSAEGVVWATTTGLYHDHIGTQFKSRFFSVHGRLPGSSHAGIAYDRVNLLGNAWSRVGNAQAFGRVVADLSTNVHRGVNGSYYFANAGKVGLAFPDDTADPSISQAHLVFQIQEGRQRIIGPAPYADSRFRTPPWMAPDN